MTRKMIVCFYMVFAFVGTIQAATPPLAQPHAPVSSLPEVAIGNPHAPLKVVMYHALNCLHCKEFKETKLPAFRAKYIDTGKIYFVFRDFPIDRDSMAAAKLAWCRRDPQSYVKIEEIMTKNFKSDDNVTVQVDWVNAPDPSQALIELLGHHGMTAKDCQACLMRTDVEDAILQNALEAKNKYNLDYAPGFLINGHMVDMEGLEALIEKELM